MNLFSLLFGVSLAVVSLGHVGTLCLMFSGTPRLLSKCLYHLHSYQQCVRVPISLSSSTVVIVCFVLLVIVFLVGMFFFYGKTP